MFDTIVKSWRTAAVAAAALAMAFGASSADAAPISSASFGVGGAFSLPTGSNLGNTDAIFIGNGGAIVVTQGDIGDLSALITFGGSGTMADIPSFSSFTPISGFLQLSSGVSVDLNTLNVNSQTGPTPGFLNISGNATVNAPGYDATEGVYSWTGTSSDNQTFVLAMHTSVPEPISVALLGLGLLGLAYGRRLKAFKA
jgi:hypothetical protein